MTCVHYESEQVVTRATEREAFIDRLARGDT